MRRAILWIAPRLLLWVLPLPLPAATQKFDVVVYSGTAGGVIAAVAAAREGLRVALLEPGAHLGGMVSGGLGQTDTGKKEVIGGYSLEFFERAGRHYGRDVAWNLEPHLAEAVLLAMAREAKVQIFFGRRLRERNGIRKKGAHISEIVSENGARFRAAVFIDSSYEGDLMAQAGVSYTWGREGTAQYGESLAGVRAHTPKHQFLVRVSPYDASGKLLPEVSAGPKGEPGAADRKVQAYNFRLCLTDDVRNQVPLPKPERYDPQRWELLARLLQAMQEKNGRPPRLDEVIYFGRLPNAKTDVNNNGAFSTDYLGGSWNYPQGRYAERAAIWKAHQEYTAGFFYFLAHDERVPESLRREIRRWGLAKDEFTDSGHWPRQLYIREARRMQGVYVMTQKDIQTDLIKDDSIGMGSYNSDSHNVQRIATADGAVENEGDMQVPVAPYQIPYRLLLPRREQAANLLVPVCVSASHVAYSTLRMEPVYMIMGQAAGVAAAMAVRGKLAVQDVDTRKLRARLQAQRAVLEWKAPKPSPPSPDSSGRSSR